MSEPFVAKLGELLLDCVIEKLNAVGAPACRASRVPGTTATWDNCCEEGECDGQAWVATQRIYPSETFPQQQTARFRCGLHMVVAQFQIGVIRCSQALTEDGRPPSVERMTAESDAVLRDHEAVLDAALCCYAPDLETSGFPWALGAWEPIGPRGFCTGGVMTMLVGVGGCPGGCDD